MNVKTGGTFSCYISGKRKGCIKEATFLYTISFSDLIFTWPRIRVGICSLCTADGLCFELCPRLLLLRRRESDAGGNFESRQCKKEEKKKRKGMYVEDGNKNPWVIIPLLSPSYGFTIFCDVTLWLWKFVAPNHPLHSHSSFYYRFVKKMGTTHFFFSSVTKGVREWARVLLYAQLRTDWIQGCRKEASAPQK